MKTLLLLAALSVSVLGVAQAAEDGSTWDRYTVGTLAKVIKDVEGIGHEHSDGLSAGLESDHPTKVRVQYTGLIRPIPKGRKTNIDVCMRTSGMSEEVMAVFQTEIQFKEGNTLYWIPVQERLLPAYPNELKPGQMTDLWVILVGMQHHGPKRYECFFLANDFSPVHGAAR